MKNVDFKFLSTITILYVEDEKGVREKMMLNLDTIFKDIIIAEDGEDGLKKFFENSEKIDLIISDIKMPNRDGLSMIKEIRKTVKTPVIITTAFNEIDYLHKSISVGISEYIIKPIKIKELLNLITKILKIDEVINIGDFNFILSTNELYLNKELISLTFKEGLFLNLIFQNRGRTLLYETIQDRLWEEYVPEATMRSLARRVRKKFPYIETVTGVGYRIEEIN